MNLRDRLLGLNNPARPWLVRADADADLVIEWKADDPDWRQILEDLAVSLTFQIQLRLDTDTRELRVLDRLVQWRRNPEEPGQWEECQDTGDLRLSWSGNSNCRHYLITTDDIKGVVQQCAAEAGWAYRVDVCAER